MAVAMSVGTACSRNAPVEDMQTDDAGDVGYVVVYSTYGEDIVKPLFEAYTSETGVRVFLVTGDYPQLTEKVHHPRRDRSR